MPTLMNPSKRKAVQITLSREERKAGKRILKLTKPKTNLSYLLGKLLLEHNKKIDPKSTDVGP